MSTREITTEAFVDVIKKNGIVVIDWWASWCAPCRVFGPIYAKVAARHPDIVFGKVDTQAEPELAAAFEIRAIPTLMVFRDGVLVFNQAGVLPAAALEDLVQKVRALDMDDIRRKVASSEARAH